MIRVRGKVAKSELIIYLVTFTISPNYVSLHSFLMLLDSEQATNKQNEIEFSPQMQSSRLRDRRTPVNY